MKLIGISGTNGAGKDVLSEILANDYGWLFVSASRDLIIPELKRRDLPLEREHMHALTTEWRRESGGSATVVKALEKFNQENKDGKYKGLVISSIRHPYESDKIHELGGVVVWVDADPQVRYRRVTSRSQDDKDKKTFEEFLKEEQDEMVHSGDDHATLDMAAVKKAADVFITNNTDSIDDFKAAAQKALTL